jgi:GTPase
MSYPRPLCVAILGRPNVGKSTLFNRILGKPRAIVHDTPGVTRDWQVYQATYGNVELCLYDTPGVEEDIYGLPGITLDSIIWLVDGKSGLTSQDLTLAGLLRGQPVPVIVALNKCEAHSAALQAQVEACELGFSHMVPISARHGHGMDALMQAIIAQAEKNQHTHKETFLLPGAQVTSRTAASRTPSGRTPSSRTAAGNPLLMGDWTNAPKDREFQPAHRPTANGSVEDQAQARQSVANPLQPGQEGPKEAGKEAGKEGLPSPDTQADSSVITVAILGRPNVGKSTFVNRFLGYERMQTGPRAGITTDSVTTQRQWRGHLIRIVDTAGLRRAPVRVQDDLERLSCKETQRALVFCHVAIILVDAIEGLTKQDLAIIDTAREEGRALIIALNKWDQLNDHQRERTLYLLPRWLANHPVLPLSCKTGEGADRIWQQVLKTYEHWNTRLATGPLNRWLAGQMAENPAPMVQGKRIKIKYMTQIKSRPPTFALFGYKVESLPASYLRYLSNGLRAAFGFCDIKLVCTNTQNPHDPHA